MCQSGRLWSFGPELAGSVPGVAAEALLRGSVGHSAAVAEGELSCRPGSFV